MTSKVGNAFWSKVLGQYELLDAVMCGSLSKWCYEDLLFTFSSKMIHVLFRTNGLTTCVVAEMAFCCLGEQQFFLSFCKRIFSDKMLIL